MFIEPQPLMNRFAPAERDIPFVGKTPCAPTERWQWFLWISYKHSAALQPGPILETSHSSPAPIKLRPTKPNASLCRCSRIQNCH